MSEEDIAVIREQFEAVNRRDFKRVMDLYADDVVLQVSQDAFPNVGVHKGKEAVGEWFGDWFRQFDRDYHFDIDEARDLGGGLIYLHAWHSGRGKASGAEVQQENAYLYRVRGGNVWRVGFFMSRKAALEAASLPEWSKPETD